MSTNSRMMAQSQNELDTIQRRARQAEEYYQHQNNPSDAGNRTAHAANSLSTYSRSTEKDFSQNQHAFFRGQVQGQRSSMEDIMHSGVEPASSTNFYRAKMKAGIIDLRSSYNERITSGNARLRSRTFHGPHSGRTRTQTYALDPSKGKATTSVIGKQQERQELVQRPHLSSPPSPPPPLHFPSEKQHPQSAPSSARRSSRGLYRSNSNLEVDSVEVAEDERPVGTLHREYGSTSSLDLLAPGSDKYAEIIKEFQNGNPPRQPQLRQLLREKLLNGTSDKDEDESSDHGKSKGKSKHKDRKVRAKSITSDNSASILKKLRGSSGKHDSTDASSKADEKSSEDTATEEKLRQKAFVHFDCQSIGVRMSKLDRVQASPSYMKNVTTGASAASVKRNSYAVTGEKDVTDCASSDDAGDGKSNDLVLSCPFFRNELGGEEEQVISLNNLTALKNLTSQQSTQASTSNNSCSSRSPSVASCCVLSLARHPACCGVAILDSSPSPSGQILPPLVTHRGHVIEYVDHGAYYYRHFFYGHEHQNYFGTDEFLGPIAISIKREKIDPEERINNLGKAEYGTYQYRIICRTSELTTLRGSILEDAVISSSRLGLRGIPIKDVLEMGVGEVQLSSLRLALPGPKTAEQLLKLDEQGICTTYKVGIMYCRSGQSTEEEMYNNECGSPIFDEFLDLIGQKVRLKGFQKYRGGLDCKTDTTGLHSFYTTFNNNEIMFHVSTILPFTANNHQQLLRKRHIGNDIVTIVFQEPGALPFSPQTVRSQFQHVFIIIRVSNPNSENTKYSIAVARSKDVPPFGPPIPNGGTFRKSPEFVDFLMAKIINAENAAHRSEKFRTMAQRTRREYLKDLATNSVTNTPLDSGSKLSKFGLGSVRKREKTRHKVVPDMYAKGALVWNVQVEDMSSAVQAECFLAVAADTIVLMETTSKEVIFTIPGSTVIGWTLQASSIRLYFGQGECILLRPLSGDMEEMTEIITRLTAVSQGTETVKMVLKRNGMGQLGFHIQSEGIVTDVESYGFAWEVGLRKGSRLVEICKVATITLTHDQIVDLLRTSAVVKVVVVPPLEDGTPRGDGKPSMLGSCTSINTTPGVQPTSSEQSNSSSYSHTELPVSVVSSIAAHGYSDSTLSSGRGSDDGRGSSFYSHSRQESSDVYGSSRGSHDGHLSSGDELHSRNGSHDSSDYSLSSISRRGLQSTGKQAQPGLRRGEPTSYLNMEGPATSSTYLTSTETIYNALSQPSGYSGSVRRQFANMEHMASCLPATGNIALELLKQTQNTKYLLGHEAPSVPHGTASAAGHTADGTGYVGSPSQGALSGGAAKQDGQHAAKREETQSHRKESIQAWKIHGWKKHRECSPVSSSNGSPRSSSKNLSGMSSEESLNSRLRPGVTNHNRPTYPGGASRLTFQEELKRLIDPDVTESDLAILTNQCKPFSSQRGRPLQRTLSDESLHSIKGVAGTAGGDLTIGKDVLFTTAVPARPVDTSLGTDPASAGPRLSRSAMETSRLRSKMLGEGRLMPIPPSAAGLDWSDLVSVATKAMEGDDRANQLMPPKTGHMEGRAHSDEDEAPPPPRPPSPKHDVALCSTATAGTVPSWVSLAVTPEQRVKELELFVQRLQKDLEKERLHTSKLEAEIQNLRADNVRLQEESQTAAAQLRRFTEWFFNTIDRQ